jgi:hypothetical protein
VAKIVVPTPNTTITSAWGKSVADQLNAHSEVRERYTTIAPSLNIPAGGTASAGAFTFTAPVTGPMFVDVFAMIVSATANAGDQHLYCQVAVVGTTPAASNTDQSAAILNPFKAVTLPIKGYWANVAAGAAVQINFKFDAVGPNALRVDRIAGTVRNWATFP